MSGTKCTFYTWDVFTDYFQAKPWTFAIDLNPLTSVTINDMKQ